MSDEANQKKVKEFEEKLNALQQEFGVNIYAANQMLESGEIVTLVKFRLYEDQTK